TIVERWMSKDGAPVREAVKQQLDALLTEENFSVDTFISFLQDACRKALGTEPEARFDEIFQPLDALGAGLTPPAISEAVSKLDAVFGRPDAESAAGGPD